MADLISRQAAIEALSINMPKLTTPDGCGQFDHEIEIADEAFVDCMSIIDELPSAEPVRHGKNVGTDYDEVDQFICSECGIEIQGWYRVEHDEDDGEETIHEYRFRYCPQCGCKVDKE